MPKIALIGYGATAGYASDPLRQTHWRVSHDVIRPGRMQTVTRRLGDGPAMVEGSDQITGTSLPGTRRSGFSKV